MEAGHTSLLDDPHFWVLMATVVFAGVAWKYGRKPLLDMLDGRTRRIRGELDEAERLRNAAQELLADCQKKHRDAVQTSQKIIDTAKQTAERLTKEAEQKLEDGLKRREAQLLERIARAEAAAVQEVRDQAADIAAKSAEILLNSALAKSGGKLVSDAIGDIPKRLN